MTYRRTVKTLREERALTEQDRQWHLPFEQQAGIPHASDTVIRMNSTYLEMADGNYEGRGAMSATALFVVGATSSALLSILIVDLRDHHFDNDIYPEDWATSLAYSLASYAILSILIFCFVFSMRHIGEWFRYTHYPIRFNRKRRTVHVFRGDGTVLEAPWDNIYFTLHESKKVGGMTWLGISGLVLKDPQTVEEQFTFGYSSTSIGNCQRHWEFVRRYMQHGPQAVMHAEGFTYCLPIADKKETPYQAWIELLSTMGTSTVLRIVMMPFLVAFFIGRMFANATCKVPLWPADVEAACLIDANDPYVRDSSSNPEGYR